MKTCQQTCIIVAVLCWAVLGNAQPLPADDPPQGVDGDESVNVEFGAQSQDVDTEGETASEPDSDDEADRAHADQGPFPCERELKTLDDARPPGDIVLPPPQATQGWNSTQWCDALAIGMRSLIQNEGILSDAAAVEVVAEASQPVEPGVSGALGSAISAIGAGAGTPHRTLLDASPVISVGTGEEGELVTTVAVRLNLPPLVSEFLGVDPEKSEDWVKKLLRISRSFDTTVLVPTSGLNSERYVGWRARYRILGGGVQKASDKVTEALSNFGESAGIAQAEITERLAELSDDPEALRQCVGSLQADSIQLDVVDEACGFDSSNLNSAVGNLFETAQAARERLDADYFTLIGGGDYGAVPDAAFITVPGNHHYFGIVAGIRRFRNHGFDEAEDKDSEHSEEEPRERVAEMRLSALGTYSRFDIDGEPDARFFQVDGKFSVGYSNQFNNGRSFVGLGANVGYYRCDQDGDLANTCFAQASSPDDNDAVTFDVGLDLSIPTGLRGGFGRQVDIAVAVPILPEAAGVMVSVGGTLLSF